MALRDLGDGRGRGLVALRNLAPDEVVVLAPVGPRLRGGGGGGSGGSGGSGSSRDARRRPGRPLRRARRQRPDAVVRAHGDAPPRRARARRRLAPRAVDRRAAVARVDAAAGVRRGGCRGGGGTPRSTRRSPPWRSRTRTRASSSRTASARSAATRTTCGGRPGVLHSRCFTYGARGRHLLAPGVDMCNHDAEAKNAVARVVHSPETCQGAVATSEIAPTTEENTLINRTPAGRVGVVLSAARGRGRRRGGRRGAHLLRRLAQRPVLSVLRVRPRGEQARRRRAVRHRGRARVVRGEAGVDRAGARRARRGFERRARRSR